MISPETIYIQVTVNTSSRLCVYVIHICKNNKEKGTMNFRGSKEQDTWAGVEGGNENVQTMSYNSQKVNLKLFLKCSFYLIT